ncbi:MAG: aminotransferase class V-fold PLP-dependent enzyme, partial [Candidatus Zixiibacteriota bacterium]
ITTLSDYENNLDNKTALILRVHQSNFTQQGFTEQVPLKDLVRLGNRHHLPVFNDLGSGMFIPVRKLLGFAEPTVQQSVNDNAAVTCFSGDKMLGGIQAGLIVGKDEYIKKIKRNPLFRTYRVDKIVFSMIEKLLACYLNNQWQTDIKLWSIISIKEAELYKRGKWLLKQIGSPKGINVETTNACVGGGALPGTNIPSVGVFFAGEYKATILLKKFRELTLPVIGRIENDRFVLDLKTVDECDLPYLVKVIIQIIK